jgi:hypothetical protein
VNRELDRTRRKLGEVARQEARLASQVRGAYMTGQVPGLAVVIQASDLRDLLERAVALSYVISADQDVLRRLELARKQAVRRQAKERLDARVARLAGAAAALRSRSAEHWIMRESSGYPTADNPTSTAFGLGQLLLGNRILYLGQDYATTDCGRQLWAFRAYVRDRYGTAERAMAFWQANGWY